MGKSEFGLDGMVGGMTVIMMRLVRISSEAVGRAAKRSLEGCGIVEVQMRGVRNGDCDSTRKV